MRANGHDFADAAKQQDFPVPRKLKRDVIYLMPESWTDETQYTITVVPKDSFFKKFNVSDIEKNGSFLPEMLKHIRCVVSMKNGVMGFYGAKDYHKKAHLSVTEEVYRVLKKYLEERDVRLLEVDTKRDFIDNEIGFQYVAPGGKLWKEKVEPHFGRVNFKQCMTEGEVNEKRGNQFGAAGYSTHNFKDNRQTKNHVAKPNLLKETSDDSVYNMVTLTELGVELGVLKEESSDDSSYKTLRRNHFPRAIHKLNLINGLYYGSSCPLSSCVLTHTDGNNCDKDGYNWTFVLYVHTVENPFSDHPIFRRNYFIAYDRRQAHDFIRRYTNVDIIAHDVRNFMNWIKERYPHRLDFDEDTYSEKRMRFQKVCGRVFYVHPSCNKCAFLSTAIDAVLKLHHTYNLTLEQICDVVLPLSWQTEFVKCHYVLMGWIKNGLPDDSDLLCVHLAREMHKLWGNCNSGKHNRVQPFIGKNHTMAEIVDSLEHMIAGVRNANEKPASGAHAIKYQDLVTAFKKMKDVGDFTVHHVIHVLLATRVIKHAHLGTQVTVAFSSTTTGDKLAKRYGVNKSQMDGLLVSVSKALGVTQFYLENIFCEMLKFTDKKTEGAREGTTFLRAHDAWVWGQDMFNMEINPFAEQDEDRCHYVRYPAQVGGVKMDKETVPLMRFRDDDRDNDYLRIQSFYNSVLTNCAQDNTEVKLVGDIDWPATNRKRKANPAFAKANRTVKIDPKREPKECTFEDVMDSGIEHSSVVLINALRKVCRREISGREIRTIIETLQRQSRLQLVRWEPWPTYDLPPLLSEEESIASANRHTELHNDPPQPDHPVTIPRDAITLKDFVRVDVGNPRRLRQWEKVRVKLHEAAAPSEPYMRNIYNMAVHWNIYCPSKCVPVWKPGMPQPARKRKEPRAEEDGTAQSTEISSTAHASVSVMSLSSGSVDSTAPQKKVAATKKATEKATNGKKTKSNKPAHKSKATKAKKRADKRKPRICIRVPPSMQAGLPQCVSVPPRTLAEPDVSDLDTRVGSSGLESESESLSVDDKRADPDYKCSGDSRDSSPLHLTSDDDSRQSQSPARNQAKSPLQQRPPRLHEGPPRETLFVDPFQKKSKLSPIHGNPSSREDHPEFDDMSVLNETFLTAVDDSQIVCSPIPFSPEPITPLLPLPPREPGGRSRGRFIRPTPQVIRHRQMAPLETPKSPDAKPPPPLPTGSPDAINPNLSKQPALDAIADTFTAEDLHLTRGVGTAVALDLKKLVGRLFSDVDLSRIVVVRHEEPHPFLNASVIGHYAHIPGMQDYSLVSAPNTSATEFRNGQYLGRVVMREGPSRRMHKTPISAKLSFMFGLLMDPRHVGKLRLFASHAKSCLNNPVIGQIMCEICDGDVSDKSEHNMKFLVTWQKDVTEIQVEDRVHPI